MIVQKYRNVIFRYSKKLKYVPSPIYFVRNDVLKEPFYIFDYILGLFVEYLSNIDIS